MTVRILLADDHRIMREGLRSLLDEEPDIEVVGEAEDGAHTVELVESLHPDVVVMDVAMPQLNGMEATRQIVGESPGVRVLALSMHSDRRFVSGMFASGASGYLLKDCAAEELARAVRTVMAGNIYLSEQITGVVMADYMRGLSEDDGTARDVLTPREREVLQLLAEGYATKQIAAQLGVSVKTIETYRSRIMDKLELRSVAELTKYAIREGLTSLEA